MDEPTTALARRWRDARGFRWYRGMSFTSKLGRGTITDMSLFVANYAHHITTLPDLDDPLTRMAALLMTRAAWGRPDLWIRASRRGESWAPDCVGTPDALLSISAPTEIEALIAALESAPETP